MKFFDYYSNYIYLRSTLISIQVTEACNGNCTYCYQDKKSYITISLDTVDQILNFLFKSYEENNPKAVINKNSQFLTFEFIGGEPLIAFKVIDYFCEQFIKRCIQEKNDWLYHWKGFYISNGLLYNNSQIQLFIDKWRLFIQPSISLDGPAEVHNLNRRTLLNEPTFDIVKSAYDDLQSNINKFYLPINTTKSVITKNTLSHLFEIFLFFIKYNPDLIINIQLDLDTDWDDNDAKIYFRELKKCFDYIWQIGKPIAFSLLNQNNDKSINISEPAHCNFCRKLAIDTRGDIYPCIRFYPTSSNNSYNIGDVYNGVNWEDKIFSIKQFNILPQKCKSCPINSNCHNCVALGYKINNELICTDKICSMFKVEHILNVYFKNKKYQQHQTTLLSPNEIINLIGKENFEAIRKDIL